MAARVRYLAARGRRRCLAVVPITSGLTRSRILRVCCSGTLADLQRL